MKRPGTRFRTASLVVCVAMAAACGSSSPPTPTPTPQTPGTPVIVSTSLTGVNASLSTVGQTLQLKVIETFSDGSTRDITTCCSFESSVESVASADRTGLVTAWAPGTTTMSALQLQSGELDVLGSGTVSVLSGPPINPTDIPVLLGPDDGAVVQNGPSVIVTFNWSTVVGATAYHLNVQRTGSQLPALDKADIPNPPWQIVTGNLIPANFPGWHWAVQAMVGGTFQAWSSVRTFSYTAGSRAAAWLVGPGGRRALGLAPPSRSRAR